MTIPFDAIMIGTGQAGPSLAARLARAGMKVAIIERARFGGTRLDTGCIPYQGHGRQRIRRLGGPATPPFVRNNAATFSAWATVS